MAKRKVLALSGSPSAVSKSAQIVDVILKQMSDAGVETRHIILRDLPAQALVTADANDPVIAEAVAALEAADGVIVATPIYKASYTGLLKTFLDLLPQFALAGKTVLPLASGGSLAHVLALDYGLRPVLQSLGARHIVQSHFIAESHLKVTEQGLTVKEEEAVGFREAIYHFRYSLEAAPDDRQLGHPRPAGRSAPTQADPHRLFA